MRVSEELLDELHEMKERGESYEDVIWRLIEESRGQPQGPEPSFEPAEPVVFTREEDNVELDLPGTGDLLERREQTIHEMADLLRDRGTAEKDDFLEVVDADAVGYKNEQSFWANCVKGRDSLKAIPGVKPPDPGLTEWRWNENATE